MSLFRSLMTCSSPDYSDYTYVSTLANALLPGMTDRPAPSHNTQTLLGKPLSTIPFAQPSVGTDLEIVKLQLSGTRGMPVFSGLPCTPFLLNNNQILQ